ncbi:mitochondrial amidoxime reducing component 2-like [Ostrinia nubilalis]|uniref:mitochondrial amidoxime reducing component 2-like n=1 Tax=Ostrinia furnacalis TaxID=93504 RepID=UPI00103B3039|nr:mitochondrial amidoxime reducing component 2-like [Ostrinia furnacalis]
MTNQAQYVTAAVAVAGVVGGAYCAFRAYQEIRKPKLPQEWTQVGTLKNMYAYPVKSCAPVILNTAECTILGLRDGWLRDRILMIVDEKNNFLTARACPELLLIKTNVRNSVLTLTHVDMEPLHVNLAEVNALKEPKSAFVWGVEVPVRDCGWEASEWLSRLIDRTTTNYRLVYYASQNSRSLRSTTNKIYKFTKNDTGALPDEVPFNLINEASVDELNTRLSECQVTHRNFRPNFVLSGTAKAYEEDNWKFVKIGENVFEIIKPCTRCILTTVDPETGVRNSKTEPLETLKSYRQIEDPLVRKTAGSSPRMGLQMALRSAPGGVVSINDPIYVA